MNGGTVSVPLWVVILGAVGGAGGISIIVATIGRILNWGRELAHQVRTMTMALPMLDRMYSELTTNHGTSLVDKVNDNVIKMQQQSLMLDGLQKIIHRIDGQTQALALSVAEIKGTSTAAGVAANTAALLSNTKATDANTDAGSGAQGNTQAVDRNTAAAESNTDALGKR